MPMSLSGKVLVLFNVIDANILSTPSEAFNFYVCIFQYKYRKDNFLALEN